CLHSSVDISKWQLDHCDPHSFPTRRSSDLPSGWWPRGGVGVWWVGRHGRRPSTRPALGDEFPARRCPRLWLERLFYAFHSTRAVRSVKRRALIGRSAGG